MKFGICNEIFQGWKIEDTFAYAAKADYDTVEVAPFTVAVDPYVKSGDASIGLLPFIQPGDGGQPNDGDKRVQTYNYRLCFTTNSANRLPLTPPPGYDAKRYELLARYPSQRWF